MTTAALADSSFDAVALERELDALRMRLSLRGDKACSMRRATASVIGLLDRTPGATLQARWTAAEHERWPRWEAGQDRLAPTKCWTWGPAALVLARSVRPGWELLSRARLSQWLGWLPADDPLNVQLRWLQQRIATIEWVGDEVRRRGHLLGVRIMLHRGYETASQITDGDLGTVPGACRAGWTPWTRCSAPRACSSAARGVGRSDGCARGA